MNLKNVSWILPLFLAISCSQTPSINTKPAAASKIIGTVSLGIGADIGSSSAHFTPRAAVADTAVTFGLPTFVDFVDATSGDRYLSATFPVTANIPFSNLTLHAYNKLGTGIGGTAIESMLNFNGGATTSNAQSLLPIHKTDSGIPNPTIDAANADFQGFTLDEVDQLTLEANALIPSTIAAGDTILQYGFVARNSTGGRVFVANGTGTITIAYKLPNANVNAAYKFKADFVIADDTNTRVTRGLGDSTTAADARATTITADDVYLAGNDADVANVAFATTRVWNLLTSTSPVCLLSISCSLTLTLSVPPNGLAPLSAPYSFNFSYSPAAGTEVTDLNINWGDGTATTFASPNIPASPVTTNHTYTSVPATGDAIITVDVTDSTLATDTQIQTVTVN
jgi:hypothetical protein